MKIAQIFEHDTNTKYSFPEIFIGLHVCLVVSTKLKITKVYVLANYAAC